MKPVTLPMVGDLVMTPGQELHVARGIGHPYSLDVIERLANDGAVHMRKGERCATYYDAVRVGRARAEADGVSLWDDMTAQTKSGRLQLGLEATFRRADD